MISMTINGVACNPANCLVTEQSIPPHWTFSGSVVAGTNVLDTTYALQATTPIGAGGSVQIITRYDASAMALTPNIGGVDLNGSASGTAEIVGNQVVQTLDLTISANGRTGGDFVVTWLTPPPATCQPPLVGTPPDCRELPPPPATCPAGTVGTPPHCLPVEVPPQTVPTLSEVGLIALAVAIGVAALLSTAIRRLR